MEPMKDRIMKILRGLLWMLSAAAGVAMLIFIMNMLPSLARKDFAARYVNIEEAKRSSGLDSVPVPSYFPEGISWPPSFIVAQKRPYKALVAEFKDRASGQTALIIIQTSLPGSEQQFQRVRLAEVKQQSDYRLKGMNAALLVGTCDNGLPCSRMSWQDGGGSHAVLLTSTPFELIKIAESMVR